MAEQQESMVVSSVSGVTGEGAPFVRLMAGAQMLMQITPEDARALARSIADAAAASEEDAFIMAFFQNTFRATHPEAMNAVVALRKFRQARRDAARSRIVRP